MRIFGKIPGHKSRERDPFLREREPTRIDERPERSGGWAVISTDVSAIDNG